MGKQTVTALGAFIVLAAAYLGYEQTAGRLTDYAPIDPEMLRPLDATADAKLPVSKPEFQIAVERAFDKKTAAKILDQAVIQYPGAANGDNAAPPPPGRGHGAFMFFDTKELNYDGDPKLVRFKPFTVVYVTGKGGRPADRDEIQTITSDVAVVRFDRDVDFSKMSTAPKPLGGWVEGGVLLRANQGTANRDDDVEVRTERLDFDELQRRIATIEKVELVGEGGMRVAAVGMEMQLAGRKNQPVLKTPAGRTPTIQRIRLQDQVKFNLAVEEGDHMLGGAASKPGAKPGKTPLLVEAAGPFDYDAVALTAEFRRQVTVIKKSPVAGVGDDRLHCDRLWLRFAERPAGAEPAAPKAGASNGANAASGGIGGRARLVYTEATGDNVILISDSQKIHAVGAKMTHDVDAGHSVLTGAPDMVVVQENTRIKGRSLTMDRSADPKSGKQDVRQMIVLGPKGVLEVFEKNTRGPAAPRELVVRFEKSLHLDPDPTTGGKLATIVGDVELEMPKQPLAMTSRELRVKLQEVRPAAAAAGERTTQSKLEPTWMQAKYNVAVKSPEFDVTAGQSLTMHVAYRDAQAVLLPAAAAAAAHAPAPKAPALESAVARTEASNPPAKTPAPSPFELDLGAGKKGNKPDGAKDHVDVRAETVELFVARIGKTTVAERAEAVGNVFIHRDAADKNPEDAVEILGERVELTRQQAGDRLKVWGRAAKRAGDKPRWAEIRHHKFHLKDCRIIDMDEATNLATSTGPGDLLLASSTLLDDKEGAKQSAKAEGEPVRITWTKRMEFDGQNAYFEGDVASSQTGERKATPPEIVDQTMNSGVMTVIFKEKMPFRGAHAGPSKMEVLRVVLDRNVEVCEKVWKAAAPGADDEFLRYSGLRSKHMTVDNVHREATATGPGRAVFIEVNAKVEHDAQGRPLPITRSDVQFEGSMRYQQIEKSVTFLTGCKVLRSPIAAFDEVPNRDRMRPEAVAVDADKLQLQERLGPDGKKRHDFKAFERVLVRSRNYEGHGDSATYDQAADRLTLAGDMAVLTEETQPGKPSRSIEGREIEYFIKLNHTKLKDAGRSGSLDIGPRNKGLPIKGTKRN